MSPITRPPGRMDVVLPDHVLLAGSGFEHRTDVRGVGFAFLGVVLVALG